LAADDSLRIWDSTSGRPLAVFPVIAGGQRLFFTGDGRRLMVAAEEQAIAYGTDTGQVLMRMVGAAKDTAATLPDPEAERFVTASVNNRFRLWTTNGLVRDLGEMPNPWFREVVFSRDRRSFCTSGTEATASVRDSATGGVIMTIPNRVDSGTFSPDGQRVATRGGTSVIQIWDLANHRELLKLRGHREAVHDVVFSPDGRLLASVSAGGSVKVWSALPGREFLDQFELPWGLSHTPDGGRLAHAYLPDWISILDTQSGRLVARLRRLHRVVLTVAFRPDGRQLATSDGFGETAIWDVETGRLLRVLRGHGHYILPVLYSRDGRRLVTGSRDGTVGIWDPESGQQLRVLARPQTMVGAMDLSPDGRRIVSADDKVVRIWNVETGQCERELRGHSAPVEWVLFSPDGARVATTSDDHTLRLWDARSGQSLACWNLRGIGMTLAFSPDGQRVALRVSQGAYFATDAPTVELWDVQAGRQLLAFRGFIEMAVIAGFSPDGRRLVTDWWDTKVRQWEAFPWTETEYSGPPIQPLRERMRLYADQYWRERLEAERQAADTNDTLTVELPFDRSQLPARDPAAPPNLVDLTAHYTGTLNESSYLDPVGDYMGINLTNLPKGLVRFQDVPFDVRGVVQLTPASKDVLWEGYPQAVEQIPVAQRFRRLHAVIGSIGSAPEGKAIGALVLHYADGTRHECEIVYGRHVRHWWTYGDSRTDTDLAQVAWEGPHAFPKIHPTRLRIYHSTWENPRPDDEVVSFDFVSKMTTTAAPFLIAVTVE
jgi:WD40 repeat protein